MVQIIRFRWLLLVLLAVLFAYGLTRGFTNSLFAGAAILALCWYQAGGASPVTGWVRWPLTVIIPILVLATLESATSLRVELDPPNVVKVTNIGSDTVAIKGVRVNDRDDCKTNGLFGMPMEWPQTLKIGDSRYIAAHCQIVRITIFTNSGSPTYTFSK